MKMDDLWVSPIQETYISLCVGVLLAPFSDAMIFQETVEPGNCIVYFLAKTAGHGHYMNYFDVEIAMII